MKISRRHAFGGAKHPGSAHGVLQVFKSFSRDRVHSILRSSTSSSAGVVTFIAACHCFAMFNSLVEAFEGNNEWCDYSVTLAPLLRIELILVL